MWDTAQRGRGLQSGTFFLVAFPGSGSWAPGNFMGSLNPYNVSRYTALATQESLQGR